MATKLTATENTLGEIHSLTADYMKHRLELANAGEIELPPSEIAAITKFLKDNNIECTEEEIRDKFGLKEEDLPIYEVLEADLG